MIFVKYNGKIVQGGSRMICSHCFKLIELVQKMKSTSLSFCPHSWKLERGCLTFLTARFVLHSSQSLINAIMVPKLYPQEHLIDFLFLQQLNQHEIFQPLQLQTIAWHCLRLSPSYWSFKGAPPDQMAYEHCLSHDMYIKWKAMSVERSSDEPSS